MSKQDDSIDLERPGDPPDAPAARGRHRRLLVLLGLLVLALFALWYDYKVARPAVEQAYARIEAKNQEINSAAQHRRMVIADVHDTLKRSPSETFPRGKYIVEAYRWNAGMPLEIRGLQADESPGIAFKTHDYYAVYRKEGPDLAFVTHFKFDLEAEFFVEKVTTATMEYVVPPDAATSGMGMPGMGMPDMGSAPGGPGGPGGGGPGGGFDPEAFFAERDADGDGKLTGDEISERMRGRLEEIDTDKDGSVSKEEFLAARPPGRERRGGPGGGGELAPGGEGPARQQRPPLEENDDAPAADAVPSDAAPAAEPQDAPAEQPAESAASEAAPPAEANEETANQERADAP